MKVRGTEEKREGGKEGDEMELDSKGGILYSSSIPTSHLGEGREEGREYGGR